MIFALFVVWLAFALIVTVYHGALVRVRKDLSKAEAQANKDMASARETIRRRVEEVARLRRQLAIPIEFADAIIEWNDVTRELAKVNLRMTPDDRAAFEEAKKLGQERVRLFERLVAMAAESKL